LTDRSETLPHDRTLVRFIMQVQKFGGGVQHVDYAPFITVKPIFGAGADCAVFRDTTSLVILHSGEIGGTGSFRVSWG